MPTEFDVKLRRVAKSLVVTVPAPAVQGLKWKEGDMMKLVVENSHVTIKKA